MTQKSFIDERPTLYIVSTPIGNLKDITFRAIETLKKVSIIFAEDTRVSGVLLKEYGIDTPMKSYYEERKYEKIEDIFYHLEKNESVALISDAGTPGISDPGFELINEVIKSGYHVVSIPGASATIAALTTSGLKMQPHLFVGFLPRKQGETNDVLLKYEKVDATLIFYESPHRISETIKRIYNIYGDRKVVLARELTKIHETITRSTLEELLNAEFNNKGEYVILVEGYKEPDKSNLDIKQVVNRFIAEGFSEKVAMKKTAELMNISKKDVYKEVKINK